MPKVGLLPPSLAAAEDLLLDVYIASRTGVRFGGMSNYARPAHPRDCRFRAVDACGV